MTTTQTAPIRIPAHSTVTKRLGNWTTERRFQVRSHRGQTVLDLRSQQIPDGDIEIDVDLDRSVLTLLVADDATIDDWDLRRTGRGKVKDAEAPKNGGGRRIVVTGRTHSGEIRVRRAGVAVLTAMCSREFVADVRRAYTQRSHPTVADPAHHPARTA
jgi:hypothetical protein